MVLLSTTEKPMTTKQQIVDWFCAHYEDPAHHTPCDEGEYVWIHGGPFDAREEIERKFPRASGEIVAAAVEELEEGPYDPDHCDGPGCLMWAGRDRDPI
jgi:hypothetical protein